jgi:hypothetical protein
VLIAITLTFELLEELIFEHTSADMYGIIRALFGEVTVLGFISFVLFSVESLGTIDHVSEKIFGEEFDYELAHLLHQSHFLIFFVMICKTYNIVFCVACMLSPNTANARDNSYNYYAFYFQKQTT